MIKRSFAAFGALAALSAVACSGATEQLVELAPAEDSGAAASSATGSSGNSGSNSSSNGNGGNASEDAGGNGNGSGNGNGNGGGNGNEPGPAPSQCPLDGTQQSSTSGDSRSDATPFDTVACGTVAAGQSYWWTFTLPASTSKFGLSFTGGLQIEVTIDGTTTNVVPGSTLPFRTNDPYYVQVSPLGSDTESYVFVVTEK